MAFSFKLFFAIACSLGFSQFALGFGYANGYVLYPNTQTLTVDTVVQDPNNRTFTYYVSDVFYDAFAAADGPRRGGQLYKPTPQFYIDIVKKAFDFIQANSGVSGLTFTYGGTYPRSTIASMVPSSYGLQGTVTPNSSVSGKIFVDFTNLVIRSSSKSLRDGRGLVAKTDSSSTYGAGGLISWNQWMSSFAFYAEWNYNTIVHEIMHAMGLSHSTVLTSFMSYRDYNVNALSSDDKIGLASIFPSASTTDVSVTVLLNSAAVNIVEVYFINTTTGSSYQVQTSVQNGIARIKGIPAGTYYVAARELMQGMAGPCFDGVTSGFLTSFWVNNSTATNTPASATAYTVNSGSSQSITLNLIAGTKQFDCYGATMYYNTQSATTRPYDVPSLLWTQVKDSRIRPGITASMHVFTDLTVKNWFSPGKETNTNFSSASHNTITVSNLGSSPQLLVRNSFSGLDSISAVEVQLQSLPEAASGMYTGVCSSGGEYALMQLGEVMEWGGSFSNLESFSSYEDQIVFDTWGYSSGFMKDRGENRKYFGGTNRYFPPGNSNQKPEVPVALILMCAFFCNFLLTKLGKFIYSKKLSRIGLLPICVFLITCGKSVSVDTASSNRVATGIVNEALRATFQSGNFSSISRQNEPESREDHSAVWTGSQMIVWGGNGVDTMYLNTGGVYTKSSDSWSATSTTGAPSARTKHSAVWTGTKMLIWGGRDESGLLSSGGSYDPSTDSWTTITTTGAPSARVNHCSAWTGTHMLIWGGRVSGANTNTGYKYNPSNDTWTAISTTNAPTARYRANCIWTGTKFIVWGGDNSSTYLNDGAAYDPSGDTWTTISSTNAPLAKVNAGMVKIGGSVYVVGGQSGTTTAEIHALDITNLTWTNAYNSSSAYVCPSPFGASVFTDGTNIFYFGGALKSVSGIAMNTSYSKFSPSTSDCPIGYWTVPSNVNYRLNQSTVWTGTEAIVWGGSGQHHYTLHYNKLGRGIKFTP